MTLAAGLVLALLSTAALSCGFYVQHRASGQLPALSLRRPLASLAALFSNWRWLAGFVTGLGGWALYIAALRFAPLSLVQATSAGGVGLLAVLVRFGGGRLSRREVLAVAASVGGLLLLGLSLQAGVGHPAAPGWAAPFVWVAVSVLLAVVAAVPGAAVLRPGAGLAVAAGLLYSAGDVATKAAVGGTHPVLLFAVLVLACHGLAFVCLQLSFQRGSALATAGVATLITNAAPILAGLTVFAERMPGGPAGVARALGFAAAVLGAALLTATGRAGGAGSVSEAITVQATTVQATMPEITTPGIATPDLSTPDLSTPDLRTPDLRTPDLSTPDLRTPDLSTPDLSTPDLRTPDLSTPDLSTPEPSLARGSDARTPEPRGAAAPQ